MNKASIKAQDWVDRGLGPWCLAVVQEILEASVAHAGKPADFQALAMTALTTIAYGVISEMSDNDIKHSEALILSHARSLLQTNKKWEAELRRQAKARR